MIDYELFCKIKKLHEQEGLSATQIAAELCLDARTGQMGGGKAFSSQKAVFTPQQA